MISIDHMLRRLQLPGESSVKTSVCLEVLPKYLCVDKSVIRCWTQDTVFMVVRSEVQSVIPIAMLADCLGSTWMTPNNRHQYHAYTYQTI